MRYSKKRIYEWSSNIAYLAGLIASDGCLSSDGRHIDLTSSEIEQLENFNESLGRNIKIALKNNAQLDSGYRVQFSDVALYDFLLRAGLSPNKSKTIKHVHIPDKFYKDFLRGLFDGDGSIYGFQDKRWKSSFMFYSSIYSASKEFLQHIQFENQRLFGIWGSISSGSKVYRLQYAKKESVILFRAMYNPENCIALQRKKTKFASFVESY